MHSSEVERPGRLTLEVGRWSASVMSIAATIVFVLVVGMLAKSTWTNNDRAEDWRRRAVAAEEVVGGLRVVIAERSQALNQRTRQANVLATTLASSRGALQETKVSVGALTERQRRLAKANANANAERQQLKAQQKALVSVASALSACSQGLESVVGKAQRGAPKAELAKAAPFVTQCNRAQTRLDTVMAAAR
jgi:hypothetical protein